MKKGIERIFSKPMIKLGLISNLFSLLWMSYCTCVDGFIYHNREIAMYESTMAVVNAGLVVFSVNMLKKVNKYKKQQENYRDFRLI